MTSSRTIALTSYALGPGADGFRAVSSVVTISAESPLTPTSIVILVGADVPQRRALTGFRDLADDIEYGRLDGPADYFDLNRDGPGQDSAEGGRNG